MDYVLELIRKIGERNENASKTQACKNFVNKYCKKIEDNKGVIEGILALVPTDSYGSLLSGGFSLILVVSSTHVLRYQIHKRTLVKILSLHNTVVNAYLY